MEELKIGKFVEIPKTEVVSFDLINRKVDIIGETELSIPLEKIWKLEIKKPVVPLYSKFENFEKLKFHLIYPSACIVKKEISISGKEEFSVKCE